MGPRLPSDEVRENLIAAMTRACPHCGQTVETSPHLTLVDVAKGAHVGRKVIRRLLDGQPILSSNLDLVALWLDTVARP